VLNDYEREGTKLTSGDFHEGFFKCGTVLSGFIGVDSFINGFELEPGEANRGG